MATNEPMDIEFRTIAHQNEYKWCKVNAAIERYDDDGSPVFHAMLTDVTKVKEAEEKADKMYDNLVRVFKNLPNAIFSTDTENPFTLQIVSEDFIKFLGWSRVTLFDDHQGRLSDFIQERERAYVISSIKKQIAQGNKEVFESYSLRTKSGNYIVVEDKRKIIDQDDGTKTMLCSLTNVTKKYHNPEEL
jgi:PAS domain S-box-containing protein